MTKSDLVRVCPISADPDETVIGRVIMISPSGKSIAVGFEEFPVWLVAGPPLVMPMLGCLFDPVAGMVLLANLQEDGCWRGLNVPNYFTIIEV